MQYLNSYSHTELPEITIPDMSSYSKPVTPIYIYLTMLIIIKYCENLSAEIHMLSVGVLITPANTESSTIKFER